MSFNDVVKTLSIGANIAENVTPNGMRATSGGDYGRRCKDKREKCGHAKASYAIPRFYLQRKRRKIYTRGEIDRSLNIAIGSAKRNGNTFNRNANLPNLIKRIDVKVGCARA